MIIMRNIKFKKKTLYNSHPLQRALGYPMNVSFTKQIKILVHFCKQHDNIEVS